MKRMITQELIDFVASLSETDIAEFSKHIEMTDNSIVINRDIDLANSEPDVILGVLSQLVDENGDSFFPSFTDNAGKVLAVNEDEDGLVAVEKGTKLYKHTITLNGDGDNIKIIDNISDEITTSNFESRQRQCLSIYMSFNEAGANSFAGRPLNMSIGGGILHAVVSFDSNFVPIEDTLTYESFIDTVTAL